MILLRSVLIRKSLRGTVRISFVRILKKFLIFYQNNVAKRLNKTNYISEYIRNDATSSNLTENRLHEISSNVVALFIAVSFPFLSRKLSGVLSLINTDIACPCYLRNASYRELSWHFIMLTLMGPLTKHFV